MMRWLLALCLVGFGCDGESVSPGDLSPDVQSDGALLDVALPDTALPDTAPPDTAVADATPPDMGMPDAVAPDAMPPDPTHDKDAPPNYPVVFPQDQVNRIDLECTPEHWAAMQAELEQITGQDPTMVPDRPSGMMGGPPPEWIEACVDLQVGAECMTNQGPGHCFNEPDFGLLCLPDEGGAPELPPEATIACEGLAEDAPCMAPFPGMEEGVCLLDPENDLVCIPEAWLGAPGGPGENGTLYAAASFWEDTPQYIPCDLSFNGLTWTHIGIRYKGNSTLAFSTGQTRKLPLRFKFDAFEEMYPETENQRFYGFNHLSTVNQIADPSFLRQKVTADLFRSAGVPSPQTAFYRIYIDHGQGSHYFGLYTVTEVPRKPMLDAQFGDKSGTLYKCDGTGAKFSEFFSESFHRKTHKKSDDYSDVQAFITALNAPRGDDLAAWRTTLEATFDMDAFIRFLAVNQAIVNWDTYGALAHNYFIYGDPSDEGRLKWIPWDFDLSLQGHSDLGLIEADEEWPLLVTVRDDPVYFARYRAVLAELIEGPLAADTIADQLQQQHALIAPYVTGMDGEMLQYTTLSDPGDFTEGLIRLLAHVRDREQEVQRFLR